MVAFGCWLAGGAEWLGFAAMGLNALFAAHSLPRRSARWAYASAFLSLGAYLWAGAAGLLPTERILAPVSGLGPEAKAATIISFGLIFLMLVFSLARFFASRERQDRELRHANERLRSLNEALREERFSLLCSQQDLMLANERLRLKSEEVLKSQDVIRTLASAVEAKDNYTEGHSGRVADYAVGLARELGLSREEQGILRNGCYLHDIGKINISDLIIRKPGALSPDEFEQMKRHPIIGEQICKPLAFARPFLDIIRHHHERVDGRGYPDGLRGEEISIYARIAAIADAWDAMTSDRPYRGALDERVALARLKEGAGLQWDASLVEAFENMLSRRGREPQIEEIHHA
jgi:putative nucleotidyltransferase with HDIG domain